MTRPADWYPLADADPLPGDVAEITRLTRRYRDTLAEIERQTAKLRSVGTSDLWDADSGRAFAGRSDDIARTMQHTANRYSTVVSALTSWAPELAAAQDASLAARALAIDAQAQLNSLCPPVALPSEPDVTDEQVAAAEAAETARRIAQQRATEQLALAHRLLAGAVAHRDAAAARAVAAIRQVIDHDQLKDSRWDKISDWIHGAASWIKGIADILSVIGTMLSVIALFIPLVNVAVLCVLGLAVVCRFLLLASGDGTLADVGWEALGLVTAGKGKRVGKFVDAATSSVRATAPRAAATAARKNIRGATRDERVALNRLSIKGDTSAQRAHADLLERTRNDSVAAVRSALAGAPAPFAPTEALKFVAGGSVAPFVDTVRLATKYRGLGVTDGLIKPGLISGTHVAGATIDTVHTAATAPETTGGAWEFVTGSKIPQPAGASS